MCGGGWQHESVPSLLYQVIAMKAMCGGSLSHPFYVIGKSPSVVVDSASLFHPLFLFLFFVVITHGKSTSVDSTCVKWATRVSMVQVDNFTCNGLLERSV